MKKLKTSRGIQRKIIALIFTLLLFNVVVAQGITSVTGTVTDEAGAPIANASIIIKGTQTGVVTNATGHFVINATIGDILIFSSVGYSSKEIEIDKVQELEIILESARSALDEVVVIGYGTVRKSDVTGAISTLNANDINNIAIAPQQAIQGRVSGVNISLNNGAPGANSSVRIRGGTSINASNSPLYVIDGVMVSFDEGSFTTASASQNRLSNNPLNMLNSEDIKSIDILKDASATAIYGARGANGVIIITTKQGTEGTSKINYDTYVSVSKIRKKLRLLSSEEFRSYINSHSEITNWTDGGANTDWQDQIFRTAISHSHNISFSGGTAKTNYRASLGYSDQEGIVIKSNLKRIIGRINVEQKALNDKLDLKLFVSGADESNRFSQSPQAAGSDRDGGLIRAALLQDPTVPVKNIDGTYTFRGILNPNPVEIANTVLDDNSAFRLLGNVRLSYKFNEWLSFNTNLGTTMEFIERKYFAPKNSTTGMNSNGLASNLGRDNKSKLLETNFLFNKNLDDHVINAVLGYSFQESFYTGYYMYASNFISDAITYNNLGAGLKQNPVTSYKNSNRLISFFGRATYAFKNRYMVTGTLRKDGSSRFGANNKWGLFPSTAFGWKISEEEFMKNSSIVSNLKLRVGYGITGNQEIGDYRSLPTLSAGGNLYIIGGSASTAVGANQYYNPNLKWESSAQWNFGVDFGFLNERFYGSLDLYRKKTRDLLLTFNVPSPAEVTTTTANVGSLENQGIEFEINALVFQNERKRFKIFGNFSHNFQKVISLSNSSWKTEEIFTGQPQAPGFTGTTTQIIKPGWPLGTFYGFKYIGVDRDGVQQFEDVNNDGQILPGTDRMNLGTWQPSLLYGFGGNLSYGRLDLDFFLRGVIGSHILNSTALDLQNITRLPGFNILKDAISDGIAYGQTAAFSSKWIQNASFLRMENITIRYDLNIRSKVVNRLNLYISGQNLFVVTPYKGYDPEVSGGVDYINYPRPRVLLLGLNIEL